MTPSPYGRDNVRKGIVDYVTGRAFAAISSLVVILLLVRDMSVKDYGVFVTATGAATLLVMFSACGLDRVVLKFLPEGRLKASPGDLAAFVARMIGLRMGAALALLVVAVSIQHWLLGFLKTPATTEILVSTGLYAILFAFTDFAVYCLQALMLQERLRLGVSISWLVRLLAVGAALSSGGGLTVGTVLWIWAGAELVSAWIMAGPLLRLVLTGRRDLAADTAGSQWPGNSSGLRRLAISNFFSTIVGIPWQPYALRTLAAALVPGQEVAAYGFFQILIEKIRAHLPVYFFASMTEPLMSAHLTKGEEKQRVLDNMIIVVQCSIWLLAPVIAIFLVVGGTAIEMLTGGKYGNYAPVLVVLLCQILLGVHVAMLWSFFSVLGESRVIWRAVAVPSIFVLPLLIFSGMNYGVMGMALVAPVNTACVLALLTKQLSHLGCRYPFHWEPIAHILLSALLVPLPAWLLIQNNGAGDPSRLAMLAMMIIGGTAYLAVSIVFRPFNKDQEALVVRMIPALNRFIGKDRQA